MYDVNRMTSDAMRVLSEAIRLRHPEFGQLADDGHGEFVCDLFTMRSFSWDDDRPNFVYTIPFGGCIEVSWHQHAGRIVNNTIHNTIDVLIVLQGCLRELEN